LEALPLDRLNTAAISASMRKEAVLMRLIGLTAAASTASFLSILIVTLVFLTFVRLSATTQLIFLRTII